MKFYLAVVRFKAIGSIRPKRRMLCVPTSLLLHSFIVQFTVSEYNTILQRSQLS